MNGNYAGKKGASRYIFEHESVGDESLAENGIRVEELYHDNHQGHLQLTFTSNKRMEIWERSLRNIEGYIRIERSIRIEKADSHWIEIPIKACKDWNDFVDSLPKWEEQ